MSYPRDRQLLFPIRNSATLGVALMLLAGCGGDDDSGPTERQVNVAFAAQVNGQDFTCGATYSGVGVGQPGTYQVNDWRFYVHDVALVKPDGSRQALDLDQDGVWQYQNVVLLDLRKNCGGGTLPSNTVVKGAVANENFTGVCFKVGVPYALNHINDATAPSPLNSSGMLWNWRGGRKFIRVDGTGAPGDTENATAFHIHLGSTQCPGSDPNAPPPPPVAIRTSLNFVWTISMRTRTTSSWTSAPHWKRRTSRSTPRILLPAACRPTPIPSAFPSCHA